jgi:predicted DNA binding CopG/RHH family protein
MRTTVRLRDDLLERAKKRAAEEGRTLTSLIEEGLTLALAVNISYAIPLG